MATVPPLIVLETCHNSIVGLKVVGDCDISLPFGAGSNPKTTAELFAIS